MENEVIFLLVVLLRSCLVQSISGDRRVLSWPISESPVFPDSPFGTRVLAQKNPRHPRKTPSPIHFLPWAQSTTQGSRIIPVPDPNPAGGERTGGERALPSGGARGGSCRREGTSAGKTIPHHRSTSPIHIAAAAVLGT
jgi:hypothetical protein